MTGYIRKDTTNNIADGNVINATDLDNEFDGVQAAFVVATGHTHDGTASEGAAITKIGPVQDVVVSIASMYPKITNTVDLGTSSLKYKDAFFAGNETVGGTLAVTGVATLTAQPVLSSLTASSAVATDASKGLVSVTNTGTGNNVLATSPTLVTPILGTPQSAMLTNATGLPINTGVSGLGTGVATALAVNVGSAGAAVVNGGVLGTPSSGTVTNLTGTASININGTVGATTANTGAFTTLTTSSTVTLNGGTANGVAYLNGSKVLTTGSALTFDGTNLNFGASVSKIGNSTSAGGVFNVVSDFDPTSALNLKGASNIAFYTYSGSFSEQMRLTSTGLGIGTSSPAYKLDIASSNNTRALNIAGATTGYTFGKISNTSGELIFGVGDASSGALFSGMIANAAVIGTSIAKPLQFATNDAVRLTLDSSGNLGLGVTPSAWFSVAKVFQFSTSGALWALNSQQNTLLSTNEYLDASAVSRYLATGFGMRYQQTDGQHRWLNAPSGTAGAAITFTQAMTLDASGNLGVGTTSPTSKLNVSVTSNGVLSNNISINNPGSGAGTGAKISLGWSDGASGYTAAIGGFYDGVGTALSFLTNPSLNGTQTEVMRLTSSGNLLVGTTSSSPTTGGVAILQGTIGSLNVSHANGVASGSAYMYFTYAGTTIGTITQNGTAAVAYNTSSDYRLKNITGPITTSGAYIDSLKPVEGTWKADGSTFVGLIAHETQEASRTTVATGTKDGDEMQGMDYSSAEIIANLIAELQSVRTRLAALEAK